MYPQVATPDLYHFAEPADGGSLVRVQELARAKKVHVVWPRFEYAPERGGLRNTAILIGATGR